MNSSSSRRFGLICIGVLSSGAWAGLVVTDLGKATTVVVGRMEANLAASESGYLLAGTDENHRRIAWSSSNLELARCLWQAAPAVDTALAERMRRLALRQDADFLRMPHRITRGGGFAATLDARTGEPRSRSMNEPYTGF